MDATKTPLAHYQLRKRSLQQLMPTHSPTTSSPAPYVAAHPLQLQQIQTQMLQLQAQIQRMQAQVQKLQAPMQQSVRIQSPLHPSAQP
jgi:peptidoglycan hydrolase CwlO-like protein